MQDLEVRRVALATFLRPGEETATGRPRLEPCLAYAIRHPSGVLLVDTGMGSDPEVDAHYRPRRTPLAEALRAVGTAMHEVTEVVNCHLHFDHCGGNPSLAGRPVFAQRTELDTARSTPDYTLPALVDAPGLHYEVLDGESEILPGVTVVPTPGHTAGHQSVVVRRRDGTVVVAGQSHDQASQYAADVLAHRAAVGGAHVGAAAPAWMSRLERFDPARVVFAHDHAVWVP